MPEQELDIGTPEGLMDAYLNHGATRASVQGITAEELEAVYAQALEALDEASLDDALQDLVFLVIHQPMDNRFQYSLGFCLQCLGDHTAAAGHYTYAMTLDATDALCALRMGECLLAMDDTVAARDGFEAAIQLSYLNSDDDDVRAQAQALLDTLN
jgi:type III secretion system low calcium response chaperone LcrH/SycD